jgi:hypothetical protein
MWSKQAAARIEASAKGTVQMTRGLLTTILAASIVGLGTAQALAAHSFHPAPSRMPPVSSVESLTGSPPFAPSPAEGYYQPPMTIPQQASPYIFAPAPADGFYQPPMNVQPN